MYNLKNDCDIPKQYENLKEEIISNNLYLTGTNF